MREEVTIKIINGPLGPKELLGFWHKAKDDKFWGLHSYDYSGVLWGEYSDDAKVRNRGVVEIRN